MKVKMIFLLIVIKGLLSEPSCIKGEKGCTLCHPFTQLCLECEYDVYAPDKNGGCEKANICVVGKNYCLECEEDKICSKCEEGYYQDENGGCSYSDNCEISYGGKCLKCKKNYILNNELKLCRSKNLEEFKNCEKIEESDGKCAECEEGFFLTSGDKKCTKTEHCRESIFDNCVLCDQGFYLDKKDQKCKQQEGDLLYCQEVLDGKKCGLCEKNYYLDEEDNCVTTAFCKKRGDLGSCKECSKGYYLSGFGGVCTKTENCYTGIKKVGVCEKCKSGFYLDYKDGKCKPNDEDNEFKYCIKVDGNCIECDLKHYLGDDFKCTSTLYCAESEDDVCLECKKDYYLGLDKKCSKFEHCIYSTVFDCSECEKNYYFEKNNKKCTKWDDNFNGCKIGYDNKGCERCKDDYYLNKTDKICYDNTLNDYFYKCASTDNKGENCVSCVGDYELKTKYHSCSNIKGCVLQDNEDNCLECSSYYCLDVKTGLCENNNNKSEKIYYQCRKTNEKGTSCEECNPGMVVDEDGFCDKKED